jgi:hydroxyacyl-ACP dehydratase HTD2-like protein with hotdog domain
MRVYIAETGRQTGKSKEATESSAFNAKTTKTAMITFSFSSLTAHEHVLH